MCTLHAPCDVKVFRTLHSRPATRFARKPRRKNVLQLFVFARDQNFLLNGWEHFSAGLLPGKFPGRRGSSEFRHGPASTPRHCESSVSPLPLSRVRPHPATVSIPFCFARISFVFGMAVVGLGRVSSKGGNWRNSSTNSKCKVMSRTLYYF